MEDEFRFKLRIDNEEVLSRFPEGAFITVSNHPFGGMDGILLLHIVGKYRKDYQVMVNMILNNISAMRPSFIAVEFSADEILLFSDMTNLFEPTKITKKSIDNTSIFPQGDKFTASNYNLSNMNGKEWIQSAESNRGKLPDADYPKNIELLARAMECWDNLAGFRSDRERNKRFTYGDQWGDTIDVDGERMREEEYIRSQGNVPLKNNMIRRLVRNVLGVFRNRYSVPSCEGIDNMVSGLSDMKNIQSRLERNMELNRMEEMYARTMEEFLIGGLVVHRKWYGRKGSRTDCWTDFVLPDNFFCDTGARDFRNWDNGNHACMDCVRYAKHLPAVSENDISIPQTLSTRAFPTDGHPAHLLPEFHNTCRYGGHDNGNSACIHDARPLSRGTSRRSLRRISSPGEHNLQDNGQTMRIVSQIQAHESHPPSPCPSSGNRGHRCHRRNCRVIF